MAEAHLLQLIAKTNKQTKIQANAVKMIIIISRGEKKRALKLVYRETLLNSVSSPFSFVRTQMTKAEKR